MKLSPLTTVAIFALAAISMPSVATASTAGDVFTGLFGLALLLAFAAFIILAAVWFFRGPATAADRYVDSLAAQFQNPADAALFRNVYRTKGPKSTTVAWLLTVLLSPTISYVYQGKWALAIISFVTLQGLLIWYFVAIFTMPLEVLAANRKLADEAFNQVMIGRPQAVISQPQLAT